MNFMTKKKICSKLLLRAFICFVTMLTIGVYRIAKEPVLDLQELTEQKQFPNQHPRLGLTENSPTQDNHNRASFKADSHTNDVSNDTTDNFPPEIMLMQIEEDCKSRVQWRLDTFALGRDTERANRTIPRGFQVRQSSIPGAGLGAWTLDEIPACTIIGPYGGVKKYNVNLWEKEWSYGWVILDDAGKAMYVVDAADPAQSNWLRYINSAMSEQSMNMHPFQYLGEIFLYTKHKLQAGTELLTWYGEAYAAHLGLLSKKTNSKQLAESWRNVV